MVRTLPGNARYPCDTLRAGARRRVVALRLRDRDVADLAQLAEAWSVTTAGAAFLIVAERLAWYRRESAELGPEGLAAVASAGTFRLVVSPRFRPSSPGLEEGVDTDGR